MQGSFFVDKWPADWGLDSVVSLTLSISKILTVYSLHLGLFECQKTFLNYPAAPLRSKLGNSQKIAQHKK